MALSYDPTPDEKEYLQDEYRYPKEDTFPMDFNTPLSLLDKLALRAGILGDFPEEALQRATKHFYTLTSLGVGSDFFD